MAISSEKTAWLVQAGLLDAAAAEGLSASAPVRRRSKSAPGDAPGQSAAEDDGAPGAGQARPPGPWADDAPDEAEPEADEPNMTPMDGDRPPGPWADQLETPVAATPPPAPPKPPAPPPRTAAPPPRPPGPWADDAQVEADEPNMTPMADDRPPGPWADQLDPPAADAPNMTPSHGEPNQSGGEKGEPEALGGHTPGVTEQFEFTLETHPVKAWGGKIEVAYKLTVQATASFLPNEDNQIQITYNSKEGMLKKAATSWPLEKVMQALGAPSLLNKSKFSVEGEISDKGVTIKAGFAVETPLGGGEVSGVLVKIEHGKTPAFGAIEIAYQTPKLVLADWVEENIQVAQASLSIKAAASIEPQWVRLMAEELIKDAGIEAGATSAGGVSAAAVLEVAIPAALAAVAVGTVVGVANMFVQKAAMDNLKSSLAAAIRDLRGGLYDGLANAAAAGGGELYKQGYALGNQAYRKAIGELAARLDPLPPPDEIAAAAKAAASKAMAGWAGLGEVENTLRLGFFNRWVDDNHGLGTFKGDAQEAVLWCFGVANEPSSGPHMKIWVARSSLPDALKN